MNLNYSKDINRITYNNINLVDSIIFESGAKNAIDPNGMDDYSLNSMGYIALIQLTNDEFDTVFAQDNSIQISKSLINSKYSEEVNGHSRQSGETQCYKVDYYTAQNQNEAQSFFEFAANNTSVEWSHTSLKTSDGTKELICTSHNESTEVGQPTIIDSAPSSTTITMAAHSHDSNSIGHSPGDKYFAERIESRNQGTILLHYIKGQGYSAFDSSIIPGMVNEIKCSAPRKRIELDVRTSIKPPF